MDNNVLWKYTEDEKANPYCVNNKGIECCICLDSKYRIYKCDKCNDGIVCVKCFKQNTKLQNFVYPTSDCICEGAENIMLLTYKCPICRDYRAEDLIEHTRLRYEFTETEFCKKILEFNKKGIKFFEYISEMSDMDDYEDNDAESTEDNDDNVEYLLNNLE